MKRKKVENEPKKVIKTTNRTVIVLILTFGIIIVLSMISCFIWTFITLDDYEYTKFDYAMTGEALVGNKAEIFEVEGDIRPSSNRYSISGYLQNTSDNEFDTVTVEYSFYGENNVLLDRVSSTITDLDKLEIWKFYIEYPGKIEDISRYELTRVSFY